MDVIVSSQKGEGTNIYLVYLLEGQSWISVHMYSPYYMKDMQSHTWRLSSLNINA